MLGIAACAPSAPTCPSTGTCTRVLFAGNSYTFVNDLPTMFALLAQSGGHNVEIGMVANGGETLQGHLSDIGAPLHSKSWTYVVLQEQSQIPADTRDRASEMYPAARQLITTVRSAGSTPLLFLTWAHANGWPEDGITDYATMQAAIDQGYLDLAQQQGVGVAPVGVAWQKLHARDPQLSLWQSDGTHAQPSGTYLAACVFYATVFRQSPAGLTYHADLPDHDAAEIQGVAADVVLSNPSQWGLR